MLSAVNGIDIEKLLDEISRYLQAVEVFRAERCEPRWEPELRPARGALGVRVAAPAPTPAPPARS